MRETSCLLVLIALLCSALAQTPAPPNNTVVFINLDPIPTKDSLTPSGLQLKGALWSNTHAYAWTDDGQNSYIVSAPFSLLEDVTVTSVVFNRTLTSFRQPLDFAVQAGLFVPPNTLFLWGYNVLYRVPDVADISRVEANVSFTDLVLPLTGFEISGIVYTPQSRPSFPNPAQLFATDVAQYTNGFAASTTASDLVFPDMSASEVDVTNDRLYVAYSAGEVEVRQASNVGNILATVRIANISESGTGLQVADLFLDAPNNHLYLVGTQEQRGWAGRIDLSSLSAINGSTYRVYDPFIAAGPGTVPNASTDAARWLAFPLGSSLNVLVTSMTVDTAIGVGFSNVNDLAGRVGYLVKFDAVNMRLLGEEILTLQRQDTVIVGMHIRNNGTNRILYVATESSITSFIDYPTSCSNDCDALNGHGTCNRSTCDCTVDWTGEACEEEACVLGCGESLNHGICRKGICECAQNFTGPTCADRRCPNDCSGNGECDTTTFLCTCDATHIGPACDLDKFSSCEGLNFDSDAYNLCLQFESCGWCFDTEVCQEGSRNGPAAGSCRQWLVDSTYDIITVVFGAIIIFCFLVMFIINVISALMEDWRLATIMSTEGSEGDSSLARTQWWRDERSAKSWKLWDQLQFISYFSIINAVFSTRLIQWAGYFNWANFSLPGIFEDEVYKPERSSSFRTTASIEQYANAHGMPLKMVYFNSLIWWLIATAVFLGSYFLYYVLVVYILRKGGRFPEILMHRVFHIITRALLAGYLPLVLLAAAYISNYQDGLMAVPIIFGLAVAVGVPVLNFLVVKGEKTDFLYYSLRIRFGAFYVSYQHTRTKFAFIVFGRKFLVAAMIGFLATNTIRTNQEALFWSQSLIPAGLMLVYIVLLVIFNPYIDLVHTILDIILNLINIITLATGYLHRSTRVEDKTAGVFVAMILQIAGLVFVIFAYLWTWLFYAGYTSPGQLCSGKPDPAAESGDKKGGDAAAKKPEEKKKEEVKAVDATNLKDLEISESSSS